MNPDFGGQGSGEAQHHWREAPRHEDLLSAWDIAWSQPFSQDAQDLSEAGPREDAGPTCPKTPRCA